MKSGFLMRMAIGTSAICCGLLTIWLWINIHLPDNSNDHEMRSGLQMSIGKLPFLRKLHGEAVIQQPNNAPSQSQSARLGEECPQSDKGQSPMYLHAQYYLEHIGFAADTVASVSELAASLHRTAILPVVEDGQPTGYRIGMEGARAACLEELVDLGRAESGTMFEKEDDQTKCDQARQPCADGWDVLIAIRHQPSQSVLPPDPVPLSLVAEQKHRTFNDILNISSLVGNASAKYWDCTEDFEESLSKEDGIQMRCQQNRTVFCVDGRDPHGMRSLHSDLLRNARCINILSWTIRSNAWLPNVGNGNFFSRSSYDADGPPRLLVSSRVKHKAYVFKSEHLGMTYISLHVQAVSLLLRHSQAPRVLKQLIDKVIAQVRSTLSTDRSAELLLVTDIPHWSAVPSPDVRQIRAMQVATWHMRRLSRALQPVTLDQVTDLSWRHLMEYELLASSDYLVTVGDTTIKNWVEKEFLRRHPSNSFKDKIQWHFDV